MSLRDRRRAVAASVCAVVVVAGLAAITDASPVGASGGSPCGAAINPITCENQQPGTPDSVWDINGVGDQTIQGFATDISVNVGNTINFKIKTDASAYTIDIYRLGWYGGNGARKVASITPSAALPQTQPACATDPSTTLYDCGTWAVSASWAVPSTTVSGVFIADLIRTDTHGMSQIPFIVRNDASTSDIVYQTSDPTWEAYNRYGGADFYTGSTTNMWDSSSRARAISYNRPFATRGDSGGRDYLFSNEFPAIRYLERNGFDVTYISGVDTDRYGASLLTHHKVFLSVGHDEYWSQAQRTNVENARDAGVNLMFLSGNEVFWHTRYGPSIDGTNSSYRTLICYKETWDNAATDPSGEATATWRDPRFSAAPGGSNPENALSGTIYMANSTDLPLTVTASQGQTRLWRNTGLSTMSGSSTDVGQHIVGYESDEDVDNGFRNAGQVDLSTTVGPTSQYLSDFGQYSSPGTTTHHITLYRAASGALVFGAGTIQWAWGLDDDHDGTATTQSPQMQQAMINLLADMRVQPQTLMSGLTAASASTDTTAPTSTITSPVAGTQIANGTAVTVTGTATDVGGVVAGVEVSLDGGASWHEASGTTAWSYTAVIHGSGSVSILSRATDDSMNTETPSAGSTVQVGCPCSLFGQATPTLVDSGDASSVSVGVRFSATTTGYVTGVRFYKGSANVGTHTGSLWSSSGTRLATGTFTNETASGWQTMQFASPVAIGANTTYVVSYWAPSGHYSETDRFFYYGTYNAAPLKAQTNSPTDPSKKNGTYSRGDSFPTSTYIGANYYVDPMFVPVANGIPSVVSTTPDTDATNVATSVTPSATFTSSMDPASITMTVSGPVGSIDGSVNYDAPSKTVTFTPTVPLASGTTYQVSVTGTGTNGNAMIVPATWSFRTSGSPACPCTLFTTGAEPGVADSGDSSALTVGTTITPSASGYITGARFYKSAANTGTHIAGLWTTSGTRLAVSTFSNESATGWQSVSFSPAVAVTAGTSYIVSYYAPNGHYAEDDHYFDTSVVNPPLSAPVGAGVYSYGTDQFPSASYANANYWVDAVFQTQAPSNGPAVTSTTPAAGASGVDPSTSVTATFSIPVSASSVAISVTSPTGAVAGTTSYDAPTRTVTFTPSGALSSSASFVAQVSARGTNGVTMSAPYSWSFRTVSVCPCTLFPAAATPVTADSGDSSAVTLGVQFSSIEQGVITGVRFYKAASNVGTHVGALWGADGTQLATATFTGESATGWQTVTFASPVTITPGTTYVASYTAPSGHYAEDDGYFANPVSSGPLTAPVAAGVYAIGMSAFPASTYGRANYWVDPIFQSTATPPPSAPIVTSTTPADGAAAVALSVAPTAAFSAPVTASSVNFALSSSSGAVSGTISYDPPSQTATFTPSAALAYSTTYTAAVSATGTNGGTMSAPTTWSFTTVAPPAAPTISSTSPANGATGTSTSARPAATFGAPVTPGSVLLTLTDPGGAVVAGSTAYDVPSQTATFTPSAALAYSTTYTAAVSATGTNGGTMPAPATWSFTTVAPPAAPTISSTSPANGATGTSTSARPAATFGAPVTPASVLMTLTAPGGATLAGSTAYDVPSQTATFTPSAVLAYSTTYTASVLGTGTNGAIMPNAVTWTFTTAPPPPPTISSTSPANGATGVATLPTAAATFSAPVTPSSLVMTLTGPAGAIAGTAAYVASTQTATFTPSVVLAYATTYTVSVRATGTNGGVMPAPVTWTFTTQRDTTAPVITAVVATSSGTSATVTWTTNEVSSSRVDYGTSATSLTLSATSPGAVTAHSVTLAGLAANTRYYYRVTSVDPSGNSASSPASGTPPSFAPVIAPLVDTTTTDFGAGTLSSTYVASNGDGEVILTPGYVAEFAGTTLPTTLASSATVTGGKTTVANGLATVSGATLKTTGTFGNGRSLQTLATLRPGHSVGFLTSLNANAQIRFAVDASNRLVVNVNDGVSGTTSVVVATNWTPAMHTYLISWLPSSVTFFVDGTQVYTKSFITLFGTTYRTQFTDPSLDGGLLIDWMRQGTYPTTGTFASRVFDAAATVSWDALSWDATVPSGTTLSVKVRTGNTAVPGTGWTAWTAITSGQAVGKNARYLQYQVTMTSPATVLMTPAVRSVTITAHV